MIRLNFIPSEQRHSRGSLWQDGLGPLPREVVIGLFVLAAGVLFIVHLAFAGVTAGRLVQQAVLEVRWNGLAGEKKILDDISNETKTLQQKMNGLLPITSVKGGAWGRLLNDISDSVPKGLWLRKINFQKGLLTIDGSAVSKARNEMIITNNFVAALKERPSLQSGFTGIDIDSIERREKTALSIADFSVKARLPEIAAPSVSGPKPKGVTR